jgi:hypothetical protein
MDNSFSATKRLYRRAQKPSRKLSWRMAARCLLTRWPTQVPQPVEVTRGQYGEFSGSARNSEKSGCASISATHLPLPQLISSDRFAGPFLSHRGITMTVPALRERPRDLPLLIAAEIAVASRRQERRSRSGADI